MFTPLASCRLSDIQRRERSKRKHNRLVAMFGVRQGKGTWPHVAPKGNPVFVPIPRPATFLSSMLSLFRRFRVPRH